MALTLLLVKILIRDKSEVGTHVNFRSYRGDPKAERRDTNSNEDVNRQLAVQNKQLSIAKTAGTLQTKPEGEAISTVVDVF